jgi:hypothetical protein
MGWKVITMGGLGGDEVGGDYTGMNLNGLGLNDRDSD